MQALTWEAKVSRGGGVDWGGVGSGQAQVHSPDCGCHCPAVGPVPFRSLWENPGCAQGSKLVSLGLRMVQLKGNTAKFSIPCYQETLLTWAPGDLAADIFPLLL